MEKLIIGRGLLAGALGGIVAFVFARIFVEPVIGRAIAYEEGVGAAHDAAHGGHSHEEGVELFTRGVQANVGMGFGVLAFSVAMGALLAVLFCVAYGRIGDLSARALSVLLAGGMLLSLWVVPALKYPPNPPAVSLDETITQRTLLYLLMAVSSTALLVGSCVPAAAANRPARRLERHACRGWRVRGCGGGRHADPANHPRNARTTRRRRRHHRLGGIPRR